MPVISVAVDGTLLSVVVYLVLSSLANVISRSLAARKYPKCKPPTVMPAKYPFGVDMVGKIQDAAKNRLLVRWFQKQHESFNYTFSYRVLSSRVVSTCEPENVQAVLATQFKDFGLGHRNTIFRPLFGDGIFTTDGAAWEHSRALLRPQFSRDQISDLAVTEDHCQKLFEAIVRKIDGDGEIDLQPLFFNFTIDTATEFLFGESVDVQTKPLEDGRMDFPQAFDTSQKHIIRRGRYRPFHHLYRSKEFEDANSICKSFVNYYVDRAIEIVTTDNRQGTEKAPGKYIFAVELAKVTTDKTTLRDQMLNIILAGRDTTASLLSWTFYCLARHQRVLEKLRQELFEQFGHYDDENLTPTFESLKRSKYLQWVLNEVLRLFPLVPINARIAMKDTTIPTGGGVDKKSPIFLPKGSRVEYHPFTMHRRKDLWGEDAEEFRPERWGENSTRKGLGAASTWKYLPFNGGPRICLGQQFALTEASYVVVRLLQRFSKVEVAKGQDGYGKEDGMDHDAPMYNTMLTMSIAPGCKVKLTAASNDS